MAYRFLVVLVGLLGVVGLVTPWVTVRRAERLRRAGTPWPEIARATWTGRQVGAAATSAVSLTSAAIVVAPDRHAPWRWAAGAALCLAVTLLLRLNSERSAYRVVGASTRWAMLLRRTLVTGAFPAMVCLVPLWPAVAAASRPVGVGLVVAEGVVVLVLTRWSLALSRAAGIARRLVPGEGPAPVMGESLWSVDTSVANAFAFPLSRAVVFTAPLLAQLSPAELAAVHRHEVAHLREPVAVRIRRFLPPVFGAMLFVAVPQPDLVWIPWVVVIVSGLLGGRRMSRRLEARADAAAHSSDDDGSAYADALTAIHRQALIPVRTKGGTHPSLVDRLGAAGRTPDFAVPRAVAASGGPLVLAVWIAFGVAISLATSVAP